MAIARRLYLSLVAAAALAVWAAGAERALRLLFATIGELLSAPAIVTDPEVVRRQLSVALALLVVGFPIWAIHWWLMQRAAARDAAEARSAIRSAFLTIVLAVTFLRWAGAGVELLRQLLAALLGVAEPAAVTLPAVADDLAAFLVAAVLWLAHAQLVRTARRTVPLVGVADWLPRLYGYAAATVGVSMLVWGSVGLLRLAIDAVVAPGVVSGSARLPLARDSALLVTGLVVWALHWGESLRLLAGSGAVSDRERRSLVRWAYLGFVVFASLATMLVAVAVMLDLVLRWLFGLPDGDLPQRVRALLHPAAWAVVAAAVWWYHRSVMRAEAQTLAASPVSGPDWARGVTRFLLYLSAFVGLAFTVFGLGGLLGTAIDAAVSVVTGLPWGEWRGALALQIAVTLTGGGTWLVSWREVLLRSAHAPEEERRSLSRRVYLFSVLGLSVLALLGTLGYVVYQAILWVVGLVGFADALHTASGPLGYVLVSALVAAYHLGMVAREGRALTERPAAVTVRLVLRLPPESDPEAVVRELADHLPPGAALERAT